MKQKFESDINKSNGKIIANDQTMIKVILINIFPFLKLYQWIINNRIKILISNSNNKSFWLYIRNVIYVIENLE